MGDDVQPDVCTIRIEHQRVLTVCRCHLNFGKRVYDRLLLTLILFLTIFAGHLSEKDTDLIAIGWLKFEGVHVVVVPILRCHQKTVAILRIFTLLVLKHHGRVRKCSSLRFRATFFSSFLLFLLVLCRSSSSYLLLVLLIFTKCCVILKVHSLCGAFLINPCSDHLNLLIWSSQNKL